VPIVIGRIEASLCRIAHFDYWGETVRRSVLLDSKADLLLFIHAERAIVEVTHRETNPHNARVLVQAHGDRYVGLNPPPIPLSTEEMGWVFDRPFQRMLLSVRRGQNTCLRHESLVGEDHARLLRWL
jgi:radical SAM superfamily enzyme YgiQ (UPF0313 family)